MTVKEKIHTLLSPVIHIDYSNSDYNSYPRAIYHFITPNSFHLSNSRHSRKFTYQITVFSDVPLEIENNENLDNIQKILEDNKFTTTDWEEITSDDSDIELSSFQYVIDVTAKADE